MWSDTAAAFRFSLAFLSLYHTQQLFLDQRVCIVLPFAVSLLLVTLSPYFHFFLFSSSPHPFMGPSSLPLLTYSSFNQLPCSSPAVLCSFCCSSQWIFDAVKCVTGWETLAPPPTHFLSVTSSLSTHHLLSPSLSLSFYSWVSFSAVIWARSFSLDSPLPHCIFLPCFLLSPLPPSL